MQCPFTQGNAPRDSLKRHVEKKEFPCIMAKTALRNDQILSHSCGALASREAAEKSIQSLLNAPEEQQHFQSIANVFAPLDEDNERVFEKRLWQHLARMRRIDGTNPTEAGVSDCPTESNFRFCIGGKGYYVIGMHPGASRRARRTKFPTIVFNAHSQFDALRKRGTYTTVRDRIRENDETLNGSYNPMVEDFGERSEACQYSGRAVADNWQVPVNWPQPKENVYD